MEIKCMKTFSIKKTENIEKSKYLKKLKELTIV